MQITHISDRACSALDGAHRKAYVNTAQGRAEFAAECAGAENYAEALAAWGDAPTVEEPAPEPAPEPESDPMVDIAELVVDNTLKIELLELRMEEV